MGTNWSYCLSNYCRIYYCSIELFILSDQYKKTKVVKQISALKQGTYLIGLNYPAVLQLIDYIQRTCHWQLLLHTVVSKKEFSTLPCSPFMPSHIFISNRLSSYCFHNLCSSIRITCHHHCTCCKII